MAQYQHLRVERHIERIIDRITAMIMGVVVGGVEKQHEPHRKRHGVGLGRLREFHIRLEVGYNDDGDRLDYLIVVFERPP